VRQLPQQRQAVHLGHVDVAQHEIDVRVGVELRERLDAVVREQEVVPAVANLTPELLLDEQLQIRLVVDDEDPSGHWDSCWAA
jgi:hypothetical protein